MSKETYWRSKSDHYVQGADSIRLMCENPKAALAEDAAILAKLFLIVEAFEQLSSLC